MALSDYKGTSLRMKVFYGFLTVCILSVLGATITSYYIQKETAESQNKSELQHKSEILMSSLDYAVSHTIVNTVDIPKVLGNKIFEISDINKQDIILYDLQGKYILSNKDLNLVSQKSVPPKLLKDIVVSDKRIDIHEFDQKIKGNVTSSYMKLKNNMLEPIAIVYFPFYHNDASYFDAFNRYLKMVIIGNLLLIILSAWLSWIISKSLTKNIRKISEEITKINFLGKDIKPIKYFNNDELTPLVNSYNRIIKTIDEQKELLAFREKETAWREMAKQVAHEVKNPLTPMKLLIQNFERKFDATDPNIYEKVKKMSHTVVDQIDIIATVASAFSEFAKLPEKNNEVINVNHELKTLINVFNEDNSIHLHVNKDSIMMNFDKVFFSRIMTNLITNAQQASSEGKKSIINIDLEHVNKKVKITVEDNGVGISSEVLERIFEPNFTTKNSGMGLGLTMVKKMIDDYKGDIQVKSEVGKGTKFTIILPTNL